MLTGIDIWFISFETEFLLFRVNWILQINRAEIKLVTITDV